MSTPRQGSADISVRRGSGLFISRRAFGDACDEIKIDSSHVFLRPKPLWSSRGDMTGNSLMLHIGERIKEIFDRQPKNHSIEWFAEKLHCKRSNVYNIFSRSTIDTDLLFHISKILDHDFFRDLTLELYRFNSDDRTEKQELYDDIMHSIGQLLSRKLSWLSLPDNCASHYCLNSDDPDGSPLPPAIPVPPTSTTALSPQSPTPHLTLKNEPPHSGILRP